MPGQAQAEMGLEEAEAIVARGLAGLPEVASVHYEADHDEWHLVIVHDYPLDTDYVGKITEQIIRFEGWVPHLYLEPLIISAAEDERHGITRGKKAIYVRK